MEDKQLKMCRFWILVGTVVLLCTPVGADIGRVHTGLRSQMFRCLGGANGFSIRDGRSRLQQSLTTLLQCVQSTIHRCTLFRTPHLEKHVEMRLFCGVINTGEQLNEDVWRISVPNQFSLYLEFLHFHLQSSPTCKHGSHVIVQNVDNRQKITYMYCGYREPWHLGFLNFIATVTCRRGLNTIETPRGYYFILTYYAFDVRQPSVSVQNLIENPDASLNRNHHKTLFINVGKNYARLKLELQYNIQIKVINRILIRYDPSLEVDVHDGPGILSPLAPDDPSKRRSTDKRRYRLTSSFQCFIKFGHVMNQSVHDLYYDTRRSHVLRLSWGSVSVTNPTECRTNINGTFHRSTFGPCVIHEAFKIIEIYEMRFSGFNMMRHSSKSHICQYGGLYIMLKEPESPRYYEYTRICSNITERAQLPYADYANSKPLPKHHGYVMFVTFPGYSNGFIDMGIRDNPPSPESIATNVVLSFEPYKQNNYHSIITDVPDTVTDRQTLFTSVWLVNGLHLKPHKPFTNASYFFSSSQGESFPSGPFKMVASSSFVLQHDTQLKLSMANRTQYGEMLDYQPMSIPFSGAEYQANSSFSVKFHVSYAGYDRFPVFALNMRFTQQRYYLCLPGKGYAVHEKTNEAINVLLPLAWPKEQFGDTKLWWNYRSGGCRALLVDRSCTNATSNKLAEIYYNTNLRFEEPLELDISLRKRPLCSVNCSLSVAIWEYRSEKNATRYHEWRKVYRLTWQIPYAETREFVIRISSTCDRNCAKLCDVAVALSLPLTSNVLHDTKKAMYVKYVDYIKDKFHKVFGNKGLDKSLVHVRPDPYAPIVSDFVFGTWDDATDFCSSRNAKLFSLPRTLHGYLWDIVNSQNLNLGWELDHEYFFAGMRYDSNSSEWQLRDGSAVSYIDWGLSHLHPLSASVSCPHCARATMSPRIPLEAVTSELHCSALKVSPDRSHVSAFPLDCSAKYWSRVLCDRTPTNDNEDLPPLIENCGEYLISNSTLRRSKYKCPDGYVFRINNRCMKLTLIAKYTFSSDFNSIICNRSDTENQCLEVNGELLTSSALQSDFIFDGQAQTSIYYLILDFLEEFYAEGSDIYCNNDEDGVWEKYGAAGSMHQPPQHPSYLPCFTTPIPVTLSEYNIPVSLYSCNDGSTIAAVLLCDGQHGCKDGEDEEQCSMDSCNMFQYQCQNGACVHYDLLCDDYTDCPDGDDEAFCHTKRLFPSFNVDVMSVNDLCDPPSGDLLMCRTTLQCYPSSAICHYDHSDGVMAYCKDGSHMGWGTYCEYVDCQGHYKCRGSYCIPVRKVCDGVVDCPTGDDERDCSTYKCPGQMRCSGVSYCIPPNEICDGVAHCPFQEDEKFCQTCPQGCRCSGTAIHCNDTSLVPSNIPVRSPSALILHNVTSVLGFLNAIKLEYVWLVNLRYGSFASIVEQKSDILQLFHSVKLLFLNYQQLNRLPEYFINGPNIVYANFSHNNIWQIQRFAFEQMINIKVLSLVSNSLQTLHSHFCAELKKLTDLYLTDNPLTSITDSGFLESPGLKLIRSSWYIVCCLAAHVEDCQPQNEFVSSCSNLISSILQRLCITGEALVIIIGNVGAVVVQTKATEDIRLLIVNLAIADALMGAYLLAIASVDVAYNGIFYTIVQHWARDKPCLLLGMLNFVSSQVSLLILCIFSVAKMVSIDKVYGMSFIKSKIWKSCVVAWFVTLATGVSYTVLLLLRDMGAHNNLCITIGISSYQERITPLELAFHVMFIGCNSISLAVILASMVYLFHAVAKSAKSMKKVGDGNRKYHSSRLIKLGRRLLLLLLCNVLSWLPFLIVSMLLLLGVPVHEHVVQWIAILGVPICACTDPFLYSIAPLKSLIKKRRKSKPKTVASARVVVSSKLTLSLIKKRRKSKPKTVASTRVVSVQ